MRLLFIVLLTLLCGWLTISKSDAQLLGNFKSVRLTNGDSLSWNEDNGSIYVNQTTGHFRFRQNGEWVGLGGGGSTLDSTNFWKTKSNTSLATYPLTVEQNGGSGNYRRTIRFDDAITPLNGIRMWGFIQEDTSPGGDYNSGLQWADSSVNTLFNPFVPTGNFVTLFSNDVGAPRSTSAISAHENGNIYVGRENSFFSATAFGAMMYKENYSSQWVDGGGTKNAIVRDRVIPDIGFTDANYWPLSGNFTSTGAQTNERDGAFIMNVGGILRFVVGTGTTGATAMVSPDGENEVSVFNSQIRLSTDSSSFLFQRNQDVYTDNRSVGTRKGIVYASDNYVTQPGSLTDKRYVDTHLGGENTSALLQSPTATEDGYSITWDNTAGNYTLTPVGSGGSFWPLSGNFSTSTNQIITYPDTIEFNGGGSFLRLTDGAVDMLNYETGPINLNIISSTGEMTFSHDDGQNFTVRHISGGNVQRATYTNDSIVMNFANTGSVYTDNKSTPVGIQYGADYSNTFGDRSLPDKGYVDSYFTGSLTDGAPTTAEINSVTGLTPSTAGAGRRISIKDNDGTSLIYFIVSDGTSWYYSSSTAAG